MDATRGNTGEGAGAPTGERTGEHTREATGTTVWLTYAELADRLGIKPESAKRRAIERRWPRRPNNEGRSLVAVPVEVLEAAGEPAGEATGAIVREAARELASEIAGGLTGEIPGEEASDVNALVERLKTELEGVRRDLKAMTAQAMAAREREVRGEAEAGVLRQVAEEVRRELQAAQAELRARAADLMEARERAARAEGELAGLRGRPWWRRLFGPG